MAILDHFGYKVQPLRDHEDPLWFDKDAFLPWLEHVKENRKLHIIRDSSVEGETNKKLQVTKEKIKSKLKPILKTEGRDVSPESSHSTKRRPKPKKDSGRSKRARASKDASHSSSSESEGELKPTLGTKSRPTKAGKSPRFLPQEASKSSIHHGSDIDTNSSNTDDQ